MADGLAAARLMASPAGARGAEDQLMIELTQAQIDRVVRGATGAGNLSLLMSGVANVREVLASAPAELDDVRLSRSLLTGLLLLSVLPVDGSYMALTEIARSLDMGMSTTHRYVSTLLVVGLLERDPVTRRYRLAYAG